MACPKLASHLVSESGLYQDSTEDSTLPPSHQLTEAALKKCTFLSTEFQNITTEEHYDIIKMGMVNLLGKNSKTFISELWD